MKVRKCSVGQARYNFSKLLDDAVLTRVVITRNGEKIAAIVSLADLELLSEIERLEETQSDDDGRRKRRAKDHVT